MPNKSQVSNQVAEAYQMNPTAKYLFRIKQPCTLDALETLRKHLKQNGIDAIVLAGDFEIYELK